MTRDERFSSPMNHAERTTESDLYGPTYREGDSISFDVKVWARMSEKSHIERHQGVIVELWIDDVRGHKSLYAEVHDIDGEARRVWFNRDHVGAPDDLGAPPEGALI